MSFDRRVLPDRRASPARSARGRHPDRLDGVRSAGGEQRNAVPEYGGALYRAANVPQPPASYEVRHMLRDNPMKELSVREFRSQWTSLTGEVVRVASRGRVLGHWVPGDNPLRWSDGKEDDEDWGPADVISLPENTTPEEFQRIRDSYKPDMTKPVTPDAVKQQQSRDAILAKVNRKPRERK